MLRMVNPYVPWFFFALQLFIAELLMAVYAPKRKYFWLRVSACFLVLMAVSLCSVPLVRIGGRTNDALFISCLFVWLALSIAAWKFCLKAPVWHCVFIGVAGYSAQHIMYQLCQLLWLLPLPSVAALARAGRLLNRYLWSIPITAVIYTVYFFAFVRNFRHTVANIRHRRFIIVGIIALSIAIIVSVLSNSVNQTIIHAVYAVSGCTLALYLMWGFMHERRLEYQLKTVRQLQATEKRQYEISKETIQLINIKCHDLKRQLRMLRKREGEIDKAELKEIESAINIYDSVVKTENEALDIILTEISLRCEQNGITLSCIADGAKLRFMSDYDIYSLFGNALDNALEAVMLLPAAEERRIILQIKAHGGLLSIHIENKYAGKLIISDRWPETTKQDRQYHGFGLMSIRMIAEQYDGAVNVGTDNNIFRLDIMIPLKETKLENE